VHFWQNNIKQILKSFKNFHLQIHIPNFKQKYFSGNLLRSNRFREGMSNCGVGQFRDNSQHSQLTSCRADLANGLCLAGRMDD